MDGKELYRICQQFIKYYNHERLHESLDYKLLWDPIIKQHKLLTIMMGYESPPDPFIINKKLIFEKHLSCCTQLLYLVRSVALLLSDSMNYFSRGKNI